jgi:AraC family transcriptional regulator of arabinose operon
MGSNVIWFGAPRSRMAQGLRLHGIGWRDRMPPCWIDRRHGTRDTLLLYFHARVQIQVGGVREEGHAGDAILWRPGHRHAFGNLRQAWSHSWVHFSGPWSERRTAGIPADRLLRSVDPHTIDHWLKLLFDELSWASSPDPDMVTALMTLTLSSFARAISPTHDRQPPRPLLEAVHAIDADPSQRLQLPDLAAIAGCSVSSLSASFRRHLGRSPGAYLRERRMAHAMHLLRDPHLTIADVGRRVGFADPFHFSRSFRASHGLSPRACRKAQGVQSVRPRPPR